MRIAIVNDVKMITELLRRIVERIPDCNIAWTAADGMEAVRKAIDDTPDLIIMDIKMPVMDGVDSTRLIMKKSPCPILIVTATIDGNIKEVYDALGEGALDAVATPLTENDAKEGGDSELIRKINMLKKLVKNQPRARINPVTMPTGMETRHDRPLLVAIGASTGGPKAIVDMLSTIPEDVNAMFIVVQHIDSQFAAGLVSWIKSSSRLNVKLVKPGDAPSRGTILIAGTDDHLIMRRNGTLGYSVKPEENPFRPSVDVFFQSLAVNWPIRELAVMLTGIGRDGAEGMLKLKQNGWKTFAQNKESCVVFGMPKTAIEVGAVDEILTPQDIGKRIYEITNGGSPSMERRR